MLKFQPHKSNLINNFMAVNIPISTETKEKTETLLGMVDVTCIRCKQTNPQHNIVLLTSQPFKYRFMVMK